MFIAAVAPASRAPPLPRHCVWVALQRHYCGDALGWGLGRNVQPGLLSLGAGWKLEFQGRWDIVRVHVPGEWGRADLSKSGVAMRGAEHSILSGARGHLGGQGAGEEWEFS